MVSVTPSEHGPRYRLLESVAAYCLERLDEGERGRPCGSPTPGTTRAWPLAVLPQEGLRGAEQRHWLRRLDAETANCRVALGHCVRNVVPDEVLRPARALSWYWFLRGRTGEAVRSRTAAPCSSPT
ncbi:hypothetical protein ACIF80_22840 [Streptomyces sp. NPDC085927]|uniref:hypothetical protein n=1 Tax=Streptomyces sp. NPDC085927 TaxID=3365738 RepID=UPI0037D25C40